MTITATNWSPSRKLSRIGNVLELKPSCTGTIRQNRSGNRYYACVAVPQPGAVRDAYLRCEHSHQRNRPNCASPGTRRSDGRLRLLAVQTSGTARKSGRGQNLLAMGIRGKLFS